MTIMVGVQRLQINKNKITSMKLLTAKEIKKILLGVTISDGHIDVNNDRFDFYSKQEPYAQYIYNVIQQITGMDVKFRVKHDPRGFTGYRVFTNKHAYWHKLGDKLYNGRKCLTSYVVNRIDAEALAHIWMCDGYLEHSKNRSKNKVQNIGWLCFEAFPKTELVLLQQHLFLRYEIESSLITVKRGFGYRLRFGGINLQRLISLIYPYILKEFLYKTPLFYKKRGSADMNLSNAEQYIISYSDIEDIVRYLQQCKRT